MTKGETCLEDVVQIKEKDTNDNQDIILQKIMHQ